MWTRAEIIEGLRKFYSFVKNKSIKISIYFVVILTVKTNVLQIASSAQFHGILSKYKDIICPYTVSPKPKHNTLHRIITNGQPVFNRQKRSHRKQLTIAKQEFQTMLEQDICRASKSNWSNPFHTSPKTNREFLSTTGDCK